MHMRVESGRSQARRGILDQKTVITIFFYLICLAHIYYSVIFCANNIFIICSNGLGMKCLMFGVWELSIKPVLHICIYCMIGYSWMNNNICWVDYSINEHVCCVIRDVMWCDVVWCGVWCCDWIVLWHTYINHQSLIHFNGNLWFGLWCGVRSGCLCPGQITYEFALDLRELKTWSHLHDILAFDYIITLCLATNQPFRSVFLYCGLLILGYTVWMNMKCKKIHIRLV